MVRNYQNKGKRKTYTEEERATALGLFMHHGNVAIASRLSHVPYSTLWDWIMQPTRKLGPGRARVFKPWEEEDIVTIIEYLADEGFPMGRDEIKDFVKTYIVHRGLNTEKHPFGKEGRPGRDWMLAFERRHKDRLSRRKREGLAYARTRDLTKPNVAKFFKMFKDLDDKYNFTPSNIYNADETGFQPCKTNAKVLVGKDLKNAYSIQGTQGKNMFTVLFCCNAVGTYIPPFTVYRSQHLYEQWVEGGPLGCQYSHSPKGWMMDYNYHKWFIKAFLPMTDREAGKNHRLLIMDGHHSHIGYPLARAAKENNVHLLCLPPNATHALQPLDVSVFKSVKGMWDECCLKFFDKYPRSPLGKVDFQPILKVIHKHCEDNPEHVVNGFKKCGFRPINPEACHDKILGPKNRKSKQAPPPPHLNQRRIFSIRQT